MTNPSDEVSVPSGYPTSVLYIDESGVKATDGGGYFVTASAKVRKHGKLMRAVRDVRDQHQYKGEFKFRQITRGRVPIYYDLIDEIEGSDLHLGAYVVDRSIVDPFVGTRPSWLVQIDLISWLIIGTTNKRELNTAFIDHVSCPKGTAVDDMVKKKVNQKLKKTSLIAACCLDSQSSDGLQIADLIAGAILFERRRVNGWKGGSEHKLKVVNRLKNALNTDLLDGHDGRVNVATFRVGAKSKAKSKTSTPPRLNVVREDKSAGKQRLA